MVISVPVILILDRVRIEISTMFWHYDHGGLTCHFWDTLDLPPEETNSVVGPVEILKVSREIEMSYINIGEIDDRHLGFEPFQYLHSISDNLQV